MKKGLVSKLKPGDKFNMLTYVGPAGKADHGSIGDRKIRVNLGLWRCDCGNEKVIRCHTVTSGKTKSCGCLLRQKGDAWHKGLRSGGSGFVPYAARNPIPHPVYLVKVVNELVEVYDPAKELVLWLSETGLDIMYDLTSIDSAYRRKDENTWEKIDIVALAGILRRTPGTKVWTKNTEPGIYNPKTAGWEVMT